MTRPRPGLMPTARLTADARWLLKAIAYGADPSVKPADRLKALEKLLQDEQSLPEDDLYGLLLGMSDDELERELGELWLVDALRRALLPSSPFPDASAWLRQLLAEVAKAAHAAASPLTAEAAALERATAFADRHAPPPDTATESESTGT